jgi:hypothetical protein
VGASQYKDNTVYIPGQQVRSLLHCGWGRSSAFIYDAWG